MSRWTHALCNSCWTHFEGGRRPVRMKQRELEFCCRCGISTRSGIYYRYDPALLKCGGVGAVHDE